jgi:hypothetical protein
VVHLDELTRCPSPLDHAADHSLSTRDCPVRLRLSLSSNAIPAALHAMPPQNPLQTVRPLPNSLSQRSDSEPTLAARPSRSETRSRTNDPLIKSQWVACRKCSCWDKAMGRNEKRLVPVLVPTDFAGRRDQKSDRLQPW